MVSHEGRQTWVCGPAITLLGVYLGNMKAHVHTKTCSQMFMAVLFVVAPNLEQPTRSPGGERPTKRVDPRSGLRPRDRKTDELGRTTRTGSRAPQAVAHPTIPFLPYSRGDRGAAWRTDSGGWGSAWPFRGASAGRWK